MHPVHGNPRTGLLRTFWEPDRVLRNPFRGLCVQGAQNFPPKCEDLSVNWLSADFSVNFSVNWLLIVC